ncbi:hypothetical protein [Prevotella corporis]|nr:hypothetical protein [Prevotella corporis]
MALVILAKEQPRAALPPTHFDARGLLFEKESSNPDYKGIRARLLFAFK